MDCLFPSPEDLPKPGIKPKSPALQADSLPSEPARKPKYRIFLGRKVMTNLDSIFKSRDITLLTKVHLVKSMVFLIFLVAQTVKNLPATQETWVQFLDWEDPLEKGMAIHSSVLAWRIPWMEKPGGLHSMGSQRVRHD